MAEAGRDDDFLGLAARAGPSPGARQAGTRLKSRIFSALNRRQAESGALLGLTETKRGGRRLCVFEQLVEIAPVGKHAKSLNYCRTCHARILGERIERAPIWWSGCPYVRFQQR